WALAAHYGDNQVAGVAQAQGPEMTFTLGPTVLAEAGRVLFLTSLFAAMLAFHNAVARYSFALGRERVLPGVLDRTNARTGAPKAASLTQSLFGLIVIGLYAVMGWDPLVKLFFWLGTTGGFGILLLITATSLAVVGFFARNAYRRTEPLWRRVIAPGLASMVLVVMVVLAVRTYATLLGVPPHHPAAVWFPAAYAMAAVAGVGWAL